MPPLEAVDRLDHTAGEAIWADVLPRLDDDERTVLAGAALDGLEAAALARELGSNRTAVKRTARTALAKLDGHGDGDQQLASVQTMMAGEYALGLLQPDAQRLFERGLDLDPTLAEAVRRFDLSFDALRRAVARGTHQPRASAEGPQPNRRRPLFVLAAALVVGGALVPSSISTIGSPVAALPAAVVADTRVSIDRMPTDTGLVRLDEAPSPAISTSAVPVVLASVAASDAQNPAPVGVPSRLAPDTPAPPETHVFLHHNAGSARSRERADALADQLTQDGFNVGEIRPVGITVSRDRLRYFHPADADTATAVGQALAAADTLFEVQDFTHYQPRPSASTIEIWLATPH